MKTIVISINDLTADGYPVLLNFDDGRRDWMEPKRAVSALIPVDLSIDSPPLDPGDNQPLQAKNLREILLTETEASDRLEAVGQYLYKLVFRDDVGKRWLELAAKYKKESEPGEPRTEGRRTILDIKPKELRMLPWELMTAGTLSLFLDHRNPISRGPLKREHPQGASQWPLHVLIVVGSADGDAKVKAREEIESIQEALIKFDTPVEPEILFRPPRQKLVDELNRFRPHVLHFIGHGRKAAGKNTPALVFEESKPDPPWEWTPKMIAVDLQAYQPRFAFINACRSSANAVENWGICEALIDIGVPAVMGMQADVQGAAAATFPGELYEALARDNALDVALAKARAKVSSVAVDGLQRRDWALATLYVAVTPEEVMDMRPPATPEFMTDINNRFASIKDFVDRVEPRRTLWRGVAPPPQHPGSRNLMIVRGNTDSGKTWLLYWFLRSCTWREMNICYVSLKEIVKTKDGEKRDGSKDLLDVLRLIITSSQSQQLGRPLAPEAFYEFNATVNNLLDPKEPAPATIPAGTVVVDKKLALSSKEIDDDEMTTMLAAFKAGLRRATANQPLIIALDDLGKTEVRKDHFKNYLLPELIRPIANGSDAGLKNVKLILAVKEDDSDSDFGLVELENLAVNVKLNDLASEELSNFARELCVRKQVPRNVAELFSQFIAAGNQLNPGAVHSIFTSWYKKA